MFDQKLKLKTDNYKLIDHPADNFIDYNSMVDNLEEEHLRRDVFTTAIETTGQIINPTQGADEGSSQSQVLKPSPRGDDFPGDPAASQNKAKTKAKEKLNQATNQILKKGDLEAEAAGVKRRGPRKKKEVV